MGEGGCRRHFQTRRNENRCMLQDYTKRQHLATKLHGVAFHKTIIVRTDVFVAHVRSKATFQLLILLFIISGRAGCVCKLLLSGM
jgi:hypothetical protein